MFISVFVVCPTLIFLLDSSFHCPYFSLVFCNQLLVSFGMASGGFGPAPYPPYLLLHSRLFMACLWGFGLTSPSRLVHKAARGLCATTGSLLVTSEDHVGRIQNVASQQPQHTHRITEWFILTSTFPSSYLTIADGATWNYPDSCPTGMLSP